MAYFLLLVFASAFNIYFLNNDSPNGLLCIQNNKSIMLLKVVC